MFALFFGSVAASALATWLGIFFGGVTSSGLEKAVQISNIFRSVVGVGFLVVSLTNGFYNDFERIVFAFNCWTIVSLIPQRFIYFTPETETPLFAVWVFVISRSPLIEATGFTVLFLLSSIVS